MGLCKVGVCKLCGMFCFRKGERKWEYAKWEYANCGECSALETALWSVDNTPTMIGNITPVKSHVIIILFDYLINSTCSWYYHTLVWEFAWKCILYTIFMYTIYMYTIYKYTRERLQHFWALTKCWSVITSNDEGYPPPPMLVLLTIL